jgi:hypothetical protein
LTKVLFLCATVFTLATLAAAVSGTATASKSLGHVHGEFTAERMGLASPFGPLIPLGTTTIKVNAFDRTLEIPTCSSCPGDDTGTVEQTLGENPFGIQGTTTYEVTDVEIVDGEARLLTSLGSVFRFHDGGSPGKEIVGPPNQVGLTPTLDWYEQTFFGSRQRFTGFLISGNIHVQT